MARVKGSSSKSHKKAASKKKSQAAKKESRVFRKLSRTFAQKLGVDEGDVQMKIGGASSSTTSAKKSAKKKIPVPRLQLRAAAADAEQDAYDAEYLSLVERERAAIQGGIGARTRTRKQRARGRRSRRAEDAAPTEHPPTRMTAASANTKKPVLQFQPATFSLQKSTAQLVQETASDLSAFGLVDNNGYVPLPPAGPEWHERNPNQHLPLDYPQQQQQQKLSVSHHSSNNQQHHQNNNPFASLEQEEDNDQENATTTKHSPAASLSFQPPSFSVAAAGTFKEEDADDPDL